MNETIEYIDNSSDAPLPVWFEPWANELYVPPHMAFKLVATGEREGKLEIDLDAKKVVVYGWPSSTLAVFMGEAKVHDFPVPVPDIPVGMTIKGFVHMMFGPPPNPDQQPKPVETDQPAKKRPWWKVW